MDGSRGLMIACFVMGDHGLPRALRIGDVFCV